MKRDGRIPWLSLWAMPLWLVALLCITTSAGCRGCIRSSSEKLTREELEKKAKEQREALVRSPMLALPADTEIKTPIAKAGHWVETVQRVKSNREDLQVVATGDVLRGVDATLNIPGTNVTAEFSRATVLPKGQTKTIDLQYFVPTTGVKVDPNNPVSTALKLRSNLLSRSLLTPLMRDSYPVSELRHPEFLIVVVSPKPADYQFLSALDTVLWRGGDLMFSERTRSFHVVLCGSDEGKVALPTSLQTMTTTAVMVWDDLSPDDLSEDQKNAIIDWLHWGGQMIISGPSSWTRLQNSFLMDKLPIRSASAVELGTKELKPLEKWIVDDATGQPMEPLEIVGAKMPGLSMQLAPEGQWLPYTGELVAERAIGRGRIVMTSFPVREQRLYRWKYFSSFFSTGLLRRPARRVIKKENALLQVWDTPYSNMENDPRLNSQLRIATRDMPLSQMSSEQSSEFAAFGAAEIQQRANPATADNLGDTIKPPPSRFSNDAIEAVQWSPNGAAWTDTSGFSYRALTTLKNAAGIVLPDRLTIIYLLGGYLTILVPINWLFFRMLGRLELAWIAAPIIALVGVVVVTRVARLDIGFARRTTEVGLLEIQGEYPRAHLTSYVALYTSLSTNYGLEFPERGSVALPFGDPGRSHRRAGNTSMTIQAKYGMSAGMNLEPLTVFSNSTEMVHAEQMVAMPGGILYGLDESSPAKAVVKNTTGLGLKSCCLVHKSDDGIFRFAWIGDLANDKSLTVEYQSGNEDAPWEHWDKSSITRQPSQSQSDSSDLTSGLHIGGLLSELLYAVPLAPGQVRLFGYCDDRTGKMNVSPKDDQLDSRQVVMAHLRPAKWPDVTPDKRIIGRTPGAPDASFGEIDELQNKINK